jgi:peptidoglycan hydrolase-like protein with peptidoglycan-binding domain
MLILKEGDDRPEVEQLHELLNDRLIPSPHLDVHDDYFGSDTHDALIRFQTQKGLAPTGIVDAQTWTALGQGFAPSAKIVSGPTINYKKNAKGELPPLLSDHGTQVLKDLLREAGEVSCDVSSTYRGAHDQARVMLQNFDGKLEDGAFMQKQKNLYSGPAGKKVFQTYQENVQKNEQGKITNLDQLTKIMEAKIAETGFGKSVGHLAHGFNRDTIDIEPSSLKNPKKFHDVIEANSGHGKVITVYHKPILFGGDDPCFHIEVPYHTLKRKDRGKHKVRTQTKRAKHQAQQKGHPSLGKSGK